MKLYGWIKRYIGDLSRLVDDVRAEAMQDYRTFLEDQLRQNATKGGPRGLRVRTGNLLANIFVMLLPGGVGVRVMIPRIGWIQNDGAIIKAKGNGYMTFYIPGVGWRRSKRIILPRRLWITDAQQAAMKHFPVSVARAMGKVASG